MRCTSRPDVVRVEPVHVLGGVDALQHGRRADVRRQRQLDEDAVDRRVRVQPVDQREELGLARGGGQVVRDRDDARFLAGAALVAHVDRRGGVVAHHDDGEPGPAARLPLEGVRARAHLAPELLRDPLAVDDLCTHMPAALLKSPMTSASGRDRIALRRREMRIPHVDDQHDARPRAAVPGLVLVGVVEHDRLALAPGARLAADHQRAVLGNDERQVADGPRVGDAAVREDVRARGQHREHHLRGVAANAHERQRLERRRRARAERVVCVAPFAVAPEVEPVPGRRAGAACEPAPLGFVAEEHALAAIRARHHREQLLADGRRLVLEGLEPRESPRANATGAAGSPGK